MILNCFCKSLRRGACGASRRWGLCMDYGLIMHRFCMDYAWIMFGCMHGLCMGFAWTMLDYHITHGLWLDYAWIMHAGYMDYISAWTASCVLLNEFCDICLKKILFFFQIEFIRRGCKGMLNTL